MGLAEILGVAGSFSLLAGWRLYATLLAAGAGMALGWLPLPDHLAVLGVLANPWVMGLCALGALAEFAADKLAWVDSLWDAVHSIARPLGGALLALALVDAQDPVWQVAAFLLGGGGALVSHGAKSAARAVVNVSPEPFSNVAVSAGEDVATGSALALVLAFPALAVGVAVVLLLLALALLWLMRRLVRRLRRAMAGGDASNIAPD